MLMNLNKENEVHKPNYKTGSGRFILLDNCRFNFGLHQLKTIIGEYISTGRLSIYKSIGKVLLNGTWCLLNLHLYCCSNDWNGLIV
jgi:hypothetical protein